MKTPCWSLLCGSALLLTLIPAIALPGEAQQSSSTGTIVIRGSLPLVDMLDRLGRSFAQEHPGSAIVVHGGGMRAAFKALSENRADIVMGGRQASKGEASFHLQAGVQLEERHIGSAAEIVFVNPALPVKYISLEQLKRIYKGELDHWTDLGGPDVLIEPFSLTDCPRCPASWFRTNVIDSAEFGARTEFIADPVELIRRVAATPAGIGYLGSFLFTAALAQEKGIQVTVLKVASGTGTSAVLPTKETIDDRTYLLTKDLFLYWDARSTNKLVPLFVDFCAAKAAQMP